jgi:hypothetical protein
MDMIAGVHCLAPASNPLPQHSLQHHLQHQHQCDSCRSHCAHVVQPVGQLDGDNQGLTNHRQNHVPAHMCVVCGARNVCV